MYDLTLKTPFNAIIAGSSGSGKTVLTYGLLRNKHLIFNPPPAKVFYFYSEMQDIYKNMENEDVVDQLIEGLPSLDEIKELVKPYTKNGGSLCVFDDSLDGITDNVSKLFTVISHHLNCSMILISQNLFFQNKEYRTMSLNAHYLFIMKSPRDSSQIVNIAKQISPYKTKHVVDSFRYATRNPFSYLLIDTHASTPDHLRLKSNFLPHEWPMVIYLEKS